MQVDALSSKRQSILTCPKTTIIVLLIIGFGLTSVISGVGSIDSNLDLRFSLSGL